MSTTATRPPSVVPVFVRLKIALIRNGLRQSRGRAAGWTAGTVFALLYAVGLGVGLASLRHNHYGPAAAVIVAACMALGWAVAPLFFFGGDDTLDPTRLAMLPLRPRPLVTGLLASSLIGVGPLCAVLVSAGAVVAVAHSGPAVPVAVIAVALTLLTCVSLARAVAAANTRLLTSRRGRDLALLSGLFIAVGSQGISLGINSLSSDGGLHRATSIAAVVRWIPPAPAVDAVRSVSRGSYGLAAVQLLYAACVVALVLRWWHHSLVRLMVSPDASTLPAGPAGVDRGGREHPDSAGRAGRPALLGRGAAAGPARVAALLLPRRLVAGRTGTVMGRQFRYVWRDPRSRAAWATALTLGLLLPVVAMAQHGGSVYQCLWSAGLLSTQMFNTFGLDGSAFWTVAATTATRRDAALELRGRALAMAVVAVPYITVVSTGVSLLLHRISALPEVLGLALAFAGALIATGVFIGVRFPYAVAQNNPFANAAPGQTGVVTLNMLGGTLAGVVLWLPLPAFTVALHVTGHHGLLWTVLPVGAGYGFAVAAAALRFTAPRLLDRLPEILAVAAQV